jgi:hypothetical protein
VCTTIGDFGQRMRGTKLTFPPVADDDASTVDFGTAINDVRTVNLYVGGGQQQSIDAVTAN